MDINFGALDSLYYKDFHVMWTQSTKCAHKVSQFTFHLPGVHTQLISHTLRNSDAAGPIKWDVNRDKHAETASCMKWKEKKKKKKNVALFRAEILLRYWFYLVSRKVLLCFSNSIVKLIFGHKLWALHSLFYYSPSILQEFPRNVFSCD